jgi:hypothetical protein
MPSHSKHDVQSILEEFHPRIRGVVEQAWAEWRSISAFRAESAFGPILYSRTVANYIFDAIARHAIDEFGIDPSVTVRFEPQTIKLIFKGAVLARFKKGDDNNLGQNNETQAALAFVDADGELPGLPPKTAKVEFIWSANELQTQLERVSVVARDNDELLWEYDIESDAKSSGSVLPFILPTDGPAGTEGDKSDHGVVIKPKFPRVEEEKEEE